MPHSPLDVPDTPYEENDRLMRDFKIRIHLASGYTIETEDSFDEELDDIDVLRHLESILTLPRPAWVRIANAVCFSQAVSALEIEAF